MAELLNDTQFENLKNYCKIDQDFDDQLLLDLVNADALMIAKAISVEADGDTFISDPRFLIALNKQVKEDYYMRGLTADNYRPDLANGVDNIVLQLRGEQ